MLSKSYVLWLFSGLLIIAMIPRDASADVFDGLEVHGFATQGFVKTSANSFFGDSENGSFDFRELGINATLEPSPNIRLSGQLLSRQAGDMYSGTPRVDFAVSNFTIRSTENESLSVLVGRMKNPLGLFNETRDVAFTRPSMFLPQVIYFDKVRNLIMSSDGAGARMEWYGDNANVNVHLAAGQPSIDENVEYGFLGAGFSGDIKPEGLSYIGQLLLETPDDRLRTSLSVASTSMKFNRRPMDPIGSGSVDLVYWIASLQYTTENWTFTSEYMHQPIEWRGFVGTVFDGTHAAGEGYFVQASWQANENIEFMFRYEEGFADRSDRSGEQFQQRTFGLVPSHSRYSKIATAGIRWDISQDIMIRVEYQKHNGTFILSGRENPMLSDTDPDWDMFSISASYRF